MALHLLCCFPLHRGKGDHGRTRYIPRSPPLRFGKVLGKTAILITQMTHNERKDQASRPPATELTAILGPHLKIKIKSPEQKQAGEVAANSTRERVSTGSFHLASLSNL